MTKPVAKITVPDVLDRFRAYHAREPLWGSLHIVLDDGNIDNASVRFCAKYAAEELDYEGLELAELLLQMSGTQRRKIARMA